ncbi:MAG: hypothetical protein M0P31_17045 [Solirubrobacteraceae bacterium]|nr:hypothetical protein [Solirubrobacteraceae bacterium]
MSVDYRQLAMRTNATRPLSVVAEALELYAGGWPPAEIERRLGVPRLTIQGWRDRAGLPPNGSHNAHRQTPAADLAVTRRLYEQGLTMQQVADRLGITLTAVHNRLRVAGVKVRTGGGIPDEQRPKPPAGHVLLSEAAERTGYSRSRLRVLCDRGQVPGAYRIDWGRRVRPWVIPTDVLDTLRENRRPHRRKERPVAPSRRTVRADHEWLPVDPLNDWLRARGPIEDTATEAHIDPRILRRIINDQDLVGLGLADRIVTGLGCHLEDVWTDLDAALADGARIMESRSNASRAQLQRIREAA